MPMNTYRFVPYARDMAVRQDKFKELDRLVAAAKRKGDVDAMVVASPQVLGDTYDEVMTNLNKLADARLALVILTPPHRDKMN